MSSNYDGLTRNPWPGTWSASDAQPIVLDTELRGSLQSISGDPGDQLTNITGQRLNEGMIVYVTNTYTSGLVTRTGNNYYTYRLLPGESRNVNTGEMPNSENNWSLLSFAGGSGISGFSGYSGYSGYSGLDGISGYSGQNGISGYSGLDGISGYSGQNGSSGYSGYSGDTGFSGFSGFSGQAFAGDYISSISAGTGVTVTGGSGVAATPTVSIGQSVATTDSVEFGNVLVGTLGELTFQDDVALAALHGAAIPYKQISAASRFYTNADAAAGYSTTDMKPGDWYYDDVSQTIYLCIDTGLGYFDFLDLTQRA